MFVGQLVDGPEWVLQEARVVSQCLEYLLEGLLDDVQRPIAELLRLSGEGEPAAR
jgi:hypothetical protein